MSDIIWGGDHKALVSFEKSAPKLKTGDKVEIEFNYINNKYELSFEESTYEIIPANKGSEEQLDLLRNGKSSFNTVLDVSDEGCILQLRIFEEIITLGKLATLEISIDDDVAEKIKTNESETFLQAVEKEFIYSDVKTNRKMIFVKGYGNGKADFSILSKRNRLSVEKTGDSYKAKNYARYDSSYADFDAVYLITGNIEFVDATKDAKISNEIRKNMERIRHGGKYFSIWNSYLNLEKIELFQHAKDIGSVKYKSFSTAGTSEGYKYTFQLASDNFPDFQKDEFLDACQDDILNDDKATSNSIQSAKTVKIGSFARFSGNECIIIDSESSVARNNIPAEGYLFTSLTGDKIRMRRCEIAKDKIANDNACIDHLLEIIEDGTIVHNELGENNPITNHLKSLPEFKQRTFNDEQKRAIDNAINTPDISLILGPPGTGKTFVIKAIVARFEELFKKMNPNETPNILITSFQHEAVDNAVVGMENDGLPPNRTGGKKNADNVSFYITEWRNKKTQELSERLDKTIVQKDEESENLRGQIASWNEKGRNIADGIEILRNQISKNVVELSDEVKNDVLNLIAEAENSGKSKTLRTI